MSLSTNHKQEGGVDSLLGAGDVFLHVVQGILCDTLLQDEVFQLVSVAVVLDAGCDLTETVQEHFIISAVFIIIPRTEERSDP